MFRKSILLRKSLAIPMLLYRYSTYSWLEYIYKTLIMIIFLPGHAPLLQLSDSEELPEQSLPLPDGGGLLHERVLDLVPSPQVTEQEP